MAMRQTGGEFLTLHEYVKAARQKLDGNMWDYVVGGTATETTLLRNRLGLDKLALRPRVLRDMSSIDPSHSLFGRRTRLPLLLAPVGGLESLCPGGGLMVARAAGAFGVPFMLSSVADSSMQGVAEAASGTKIFQLYTRGDAGWVEEQVRKALDCGYDAFCITVDSAVYSRRERDIARRFAKPWRARAGLDAMTYQAAFNWNDVRRIRDRFDVPLILKGIGTAEDAALCVEEGIQGVYVSNHGGRQLDHALGAIEVLPEVVEAVSGRATVIIDGGFSRGTDVVKALALGADLVGIGRAYCYGLAAAGAAGVIGVLDLLEAEIIECLGLLGARTVKEINRRHVCKADPVYPARAHSAFPLMSPFVDEY